MSPEIPGQTGEAGQFGKWDLYPLFVQEAGRLADRRQTANTLFLSINTLFLGGIAVLAQQSGLASVKLLILEIVIAVAGLFISRQWLRTLGLYRRILAFRYAKLREVENTEGFPGAIKMYQMESDEGGDKKLFGFSTVEEFIPNLFIVIYFVSMLLLLAGTIAVKIHFGAWLSQYISLPVLH